MAKLSQIPSDIPGSTNDQLVAVKGGNTDALFSIAQVVAVANVGAGTIPGVFNVANIVSLVGDGLTDNSNAWKTFIGQGWNSSDAFGGGGFCKVNGGLSFPTVVTLTIASPGVVNWTNHGLRVNETVIFATTGTLPTGLIAGTPYYVMFANLTANSFQVSAVNAVVAQIGDGPAVNFTGSQSGTQYARTQATEWQQLLVPPGAYLTNGGGLFIGGGQKKLIVNFYGSTTTNINGGAILSIGQGQGGYIFRDNLVGSAPVGFTSGNSSIPVGATSITCLRTSDAANFWVGGWICIGALDIQSGFGSGNSFPPNNHYSEFAQVSAVNVGTGVLTLTRPLRHAYSGNFPTLFSGAYGGNLPLNGAGNLSAGGQPTAWPMSPEWDTEQIFEGLHDVTATQSLGEARRMKFIDSRWDGQGPVPTMQQHFVLENCDLSNITQFLEVDKLVEYVRFTNCDFGPFGFSVQSSSVDRIVVEGCLAATVRGTGRMTYIRDSWIGSLLVGVIGNGAAESLIVENCRVNSFSSATIFYFTLAAQMVNALLNNWTFTNGTLSQPFVTTTANHWAVPGRKCFINDFFNTFDSMGACFTILDVYQAASNTNTVTITVASPAVINWTGHPFSAGDVVSFTTTGSLPTGLQTWFPYYVISAGLGANSFEVSTTLGGTAVITTGTQSGTHTAYRNPTFNLDTDLASLPSGNSTNSTVTIDIASPAVIHWSTHGLAAGTLVIFQTTGALPTGLSTATAYYVLAAGLATNSFEVSTSPGGTAVVTTGSQSGTQTAISNPLKFNIIPCPRVTVRNCTGSPSITDMSNGPENVPLWSYAQRTYAGFPQLAAGFDMPRMLVRGNLVSLTINVSQAFTGTGTYLMTIAAPAFNASLVESDLSQIIDCRTTGVRVITPTAATGSVGADTIAAFGNWISAGDLGNNNVAVTISGTGVSGGSGNGVLSKQPVVTITFVTTQGDASIGGFQAGSAESAHGDQLFDTTSNHGYL